MNAQVQNNTAPAWLVRLLPWEFRHPEFFVGVRFIAGAFLLTLAAVLCGVGFWWGALLVPVGLASMWVGRQLQGYVKS